MNEYAQNKFQTLVNPSVLSIVIVTLLCVTRMRGVAGGFTVASVYIFAYAK